MIEAKAQTSKIHFFYKIENLRYAVLSFVAFVVYKILQQKAPILEMTDLFIY